MKRKNSATMEDNIRDKVEKRFEARNELISHAAAFLATNIFLWLIWFLTSRGFAWPVFVTAGWGIGMVMHFVTYNYQHGFGARKHEAAIEAEVTRQLQIARAHQALRRQSLYEDDEIEDADVYELDNFQGRGLRLSDDGELAYLEADEADEPVRQSQRQAHAD